MDAKEMVVGGDVLELKDAEARNLLGSETLDTEATTVTGAINELNSKLGNLIKWTSASTATTGASGNIALGISTSNLVLAVTADGYYIYPFKNSSGQWFAKVCNFDDLSHVNNTSISYRVCYVEF